MLTLKDKASFTPKAAANRNNPLREKANALPCVPGCYWFADADGAVLYVGKSKCLRKRVSSYFNAARDSKFYSMLMFATHIGHMETETEIEALLLEHRLIKRYRPPYNAAMRQDRREWYITIDTREPYPLPAIIKGADISPDETICLVGPFFSVYRAGEILREIEFFWRISYFSREADIEQYRESVIEAARFFRGEKQAAGERAERQLLLHTENLAFEQAARVRDTFAALCALQERLSRLPPDSKIPQLVFIGAYGEECFIAAYAENGRICAWVKANSPEEWEHSTAAADLERFIAREYCPFDCRGCYTNERKEFQFSFDLRLLETANIELIFGRCYRFKVYVPENPEDGTRMWLAVREISARKYYAALPVKDLRAQARVFFEM